MQGQYWTLSDEQLSSDKMIQTQLMDPKGAATKCCDNQQCILKAFSDCDGVFDLKTSLKFVSECRHQYLAKSEVQRDDFVWALYKSCISADLNVNSADKTR
jgi:hypothetical protein